MRKIRDKMTKVKIALFGATGNIGQQVIDTVSNLESYKITALSAHAQQMALLAINKTIKAEHIAFTQAISKELQKTLGATTNLYLGNNALTNLAKYADYDIAFIATEGIVALEAIIEAIKRRKRICLVNKQSLVVAGEFLIPLIKQYQTELIPVDSEHNAIFQCLLGESIEDVKKIILTCSGGPFLNKTAKQIATADLNQACQHPTWLMGPKINIQSALLLNKGFEVIEAHYLFQKDYQDIEVIIHPESIIHSMVEFNDGFTKAILSKPMMKYAIQFALTYPKREQICNNSASHLKLQNLSFSAPDIHKFPLLNLCYAIGKKGGLYPTILNAVSNSIIEDCLSHKIQFASITNAIQQGLEHFCNKYDYLPLCVESIFHVDTEIKQEMSFFKGISA